MPFLNSHAKIFKDQQGSFLLLNEQKKWLRDCVFLCDQPFEKGHKYSSTTKQLFLVEVLGEEEESMEAKIFNGEVEFDDEELVPQISINTMSGHSDFNTIRVSGHRGKKTLHILIDSGSTHNFLDEHLAKKLGTSWSLS